MRLNSSTARPSAVAPFTTQALSRPSRSRISANTGHRSRENTPTNWHCGLAGFNKGPIKLKIVRTPRAASILRTPTTALNAG